MSNLEGGIERQGADMGGDIDMTFENAASVEVDRLDHNTGKWCKEVGRLLQME